MNDYLSTMERFERTADFEDPGIIVTYDFIDNNEIMEKYGEGAEDLVLRNAKINNTQFQLTNITKDAMELIKVMQLENVFNIKTNGY